MSKINDEGFLELSGVNHNVMHDELNAEKFPILQGLSPLSLRVINQSARVMKIGEGVEMMHAGDTPHDLYFISKGLFRVARLHDGQMQNIAELGVGQLFGEYGALRGKTRFASVYAAEPSTVIRVDLNAVQQVLEADDELKQRIYALMQARLLKSFIFGHDAFGHISDASRDIIAESLKIREAKRDDIIFQAGDAATCFYIILSGEAEICVGDEKNQVILEIRRDNEVLGEARAENGTKYAYTVRAANSLDLLVLDKAAMNLIHRADPSVMPKLNQLMSEEMRQFSVKMKAVLTK
ncbi:MAG: hypothetical protein AUK35_09400 [Zetaproteobacteria bacterium CG2_30_46_52]|nr:MAG: hypothetical protein AUK35_09400 [Zetaproteobacteria bacterium CG2_30_46_52]